MDYDKAYDIVRTVLEQFGYVPSSFDVSLPLSQALPDFSQRAQDSFADALVSEIGSRGFFVNSDLRYVVAGDPTISSLVDYITDSTGPK